MTLLKAPANLHELVKSAFSKAKASGELHYFPTQVAVLPVNSIPFQLRFSPALANKPKNNVTSSSSSSSQSEPKKPPFDPFADPPEALFVADLGPFHFLVLNKFAVVPEHFILATRAYELQTHLLTAPDLEATLACIRSYEQRRPDEEARAEASDGSLFAFFNCGEHSGASQPHRHIQLLPVPRMKDGLDASSSSSSSPSPWTVLASHPDLLQQAPFLTFAEPITLDTPSQKLHEIYLRLYAQACRAVAAHTSRPAPSVDTHLSSTGEAAISYNMAMTREAIVICPRLAESAHIPDRTDNASPGSVALNGTLLAGTALVKNEAEWDALRRNPQGLLEVLKAVGVPRGGSVEENNKL